MEGCGTFLGGRDEADKVALSGISFNGGVEVGPSPVMDDPREGRLWLGGPGGGEGGKGGQGLREVMEVEGVGSVSEPELVSCTLVGGEGGMPLREGLMGACGFGEGAWEGGRVGGEVETGEVRDQ